MIFKFVLTGVFFSSLSVLAQTSDYDRVILTPNKIDFNANTHERILWPSFSSGFGFRITGSSTSPHEAKEEAGPANSGSFYTPNIVTVSNLKQFQVGATANGSCTSASTNCKLRSEIRLVGSEVFYENAAFVSTEFFIHGGSFRPPTLEQGFSIFWQCAQIHSRSAGFSPPISMQIHREADGRNQIYMVFVYDENVDLPNTSTNYSYRKLPTGVFIPNTSWTKLTFEFKLGPHGYFKLFVGTNTSTPSFRYPAISTDFARIGYMNLYFNPSVGTSNLKCSSRAGVYKSAAGQHSTFYGIKRIKLGPTLNDVIF
jgi:hypothetical protein